MDVCIEECCEVVVENGGVMLTPYCKGGVTLEPHSKVRVEARLSLD